MNWFLKQSINYASQRSYLDDLYHIYPTIPNGIRDIDEEIWERVEKAYKTRNYENLITNLLDLELFPIKDSYVAYLKRDRDSIKRNPKTIARLASEILEMDLSKLYEKCSQPKETNRQIGPMFKNWIKNTDFGIPIMDIKEFQGCKTDAILYGSDSEMKNFAREELGYIHDKGLDFVARVNGRYVIGEAKFLSDIDGHQNAQFNDAIATIESDVFAEKIAILDGVLYIKSNNKIYNDITGKHKDFNIMSALMLKNYLYTL